jgi:hypothetical protein
MQTKKTGKNEIESSPLEEYLRPKRFAGKFWIGLSVVLAIVISVLVIKFTVVDKSFLPDELKSSLEIFDISSQWVVKEKVKDEDFEGVILVPEISFRLRHTGKKKMDYVFILGVFRLIDAPRALGEGFLMAFTKKPLLPGQESEKIALRSDFGYRASSEKAFEKNSRNWRSAVAEIYARSHNSGTVFLESFYISRRIAGVDPEIKMISSLEGPK